MNVDPTAFVAIVTAILGAGGIGSLLAFRKVDREADSIAANTLIAVNEELRIELKRRDQEIASLRERVYALEAQMRSRP